MDGAFGGNESGNENGVRVENGNKTEKGTEMKRAMAIAVGLGLAVMVSGCMSTMATQAHNGHVAAIKAVRLSNGAPGVGVDLLSLTPGYFGAWADSPGTMTAATIGDLVTTGAAAYAGYKALHKDSSGSSTPSNSNGSGAQYINSGSGNQTVNIDQHQGQ